MTRTTVLKFASGSILAITLSIGSPLAANAQTKILVEAGSPLPTNTTTSSIITENYSFIGLGTPDPEGPLEVVDEGSASPDIPDLANIVVTQINNQFTACATACVGCPPVAECKPRNAFVVRQKNYDAGGTFTGESTKMTIDRTGGIGVNMQPLQFSALSASDRTIDIVRRKDHYSNDNSFLKPRGIDFRDFDNTLNHTITTSAENILTITPGVNKTASNVLHIDGKTWIGTQQPAGSYADFQLGVDGKIVCKRAIVQTGSWADFVFKPNYTLPTLSSVEEYINANQHLPGVPSESNVKTNGMDVAEMNKILLQKIEEMTLYMIKIEKDNVLINAEIARLKGIKH